MGQGTQSLTTDHGSREAEACTSTDGAVLGSGGAVGFGGIGAETAGVLSTWAAVTAMLTVPLNRRSKSSSDSGAAAIGSGRTTEGAATITGGNGSAAWLGTGAFTAAGFAAARPTESEPKDHDLCAVSAAGHTLFKKWSNVADAGDAAL